MMAGIAVNNTTIFVIYNIVSTTGFGHFLTGHHQAGIQYQRNYIPAIIQSLVSVSTKRGDEISFTTSRACMQTVVKIRYMY